MKYISEDYFTVRERRTHKKICDCGSFEDARMMMHLDGPNREIVKNKILMSPVIDIEIPKALPTNEIVVVEKEPPQPQKQLKTHQHKLPESDLQPLNL